MTDDIDVDNYQEDEKEVYQKDNGGLILDDPSLEKAQRDLVKDFLKKLTKAAMKGQKINRVSLPIKPIVQDSRSLLQTITEDMFQLD